jgi:hypothetical protein
MTPLTICIGYDSREPIALSVACHSISRRASQSVRFLPIALNHLKGIYTRGADGTTEFSLSRFLSPFLCDYEGYSIFMDCDFLVKCDIHDVMRYIDSRNAVSVCQHDYMPQEGLKATGVQTSYPRKNWSSFMVFNNERCRNLTVDYVNTASPADLHRMTWAGDKIGSLPLDFNWLVGEYDANPDARILHYTLGTPCFGDYKDSDHSAEWWAEYAHMNAPIEAWLKPERYAVAQSAGYPVPPRTADKFEPSPWLQAKGLARPAQPSNDKRAV